MGEFDIFSKNLNKYYGKDSHVVIPDTVTSIEDFAFYDCTHLESVVIPDTVTSIGGYAFYGCENLKEIIIPQSVSIIGGGAFSRCLRLESITLPDSIKSIGKSTFYRCERLKNIHIPESVHTIDRSAFGFCFELENLKLPDSLVTIGETAFEECVSLKEVILPKKVKTIGKKAFFHCVKLKYFVLNENIQEIGEHAFVTRSHIRFISNDTFNLKPKLFDPNWMVSFRRKEDETYNFVESYLPVSNINEWKPYARLILLVNFLEAYAMHNDKQKALYKEACRVNKIELIEYLVDEKRYVPLNQALEIGLIDSNDLQPYFEKITNRDQKAKIMEYKNKENKQDSSFSDLEDELLNMF